MQSELLQHDKTSLYIKLTSCQCKPPHVFKLFGLFLWNLDCCRIQKILSLDEDLCKQQHPLSKSKWTLEWQYTEGKVEPQHCKQLCICPTIFKQSFLEY